MYSPAASAAPDAAAVACVARRLHSGVSLERGTRGRSVSCGRTTAVLPEGSHPAPLPMRTRRQVLSRCLGPAAQRTGSESASTTWLQPFAHAAAQSDEHLSLHWGTNNLKTVEYGPLIDTVPITQ